MRGWKGSESERARERKTEIDQLLCIVCVLRLRATRWQTATSDRCTVRQKPGREMDIADGTTGKHYKVNNRSTLGSQAGKDEMDNRWA